jgi:Na+/proline symporter
MSKDGHGNPESGLQQDGSGSNDDTYGGLMGVTSSLSTSMSSTSTNRMSFNRVIKDFKKALGERKTPRHLVILSRIVGAIIIGIIILTSINFSQLAQET